MRIVGEKEKLKELDTLAKSTEAKAILVEETSSEEYEIEMLIRERYSMSQELMLHRKKICNALEAGEWEAYTAYVEECISKVREKGNSEAE